MKVVQCPCGEELVADDDDQIVDAVNTHLEDSHPEMAGKYNREQILSMAHER
jgi:predicted small metal-binding protein